MLRTLSQKAFASITEIIVTAVVFVVSAAGILTTIASIRPKGGDSVRRLEAMYFAKQQIEMIRGQVDARMWEPNPNDIGNSLILTDPATPYSLNVASPKGNYLIEWQLSPATGFTDVNGISYLRELDMNVTY